MAAGNAIKNKAKAIANLWNTAFAALLYDNTFKGVLTLSSTDVASGAEITDLQKTVNELIDRSGGFKKFDEVVLGAGATVAITAHEQQLHQIKSDGGVKALSITPFGVDWSSFTHLSIIRLYCTSDIDMISLAFNDADYGAKINGNATLAAGQYIDLMIDKNQLRAIEVGRHFNV